MNDEHDIDIFEPIENDLKLFHEPFTLAPELWGKFDLNDLNIDFSNWKKIKLIVNGSFSSELSKIPNQFGGIYIYSIEPGIVPNVGSYIMYIGMATKTKYENLRNRVRSYKKFLNNNDRQKLNRLFVNWGDYVYVSYLSIDSDMPTIRAVEDRLIGVFGRPPCNKDVRIKSVNDAVNAFK